jgi:hypothetical protein
MDDDVFYSELNENEAQRIIAENDFVQRNTKISKVIILYNII